EATTVAEVSAKGSTDSGRRAQIVSGCPDSTMRRAMGPPWFPRPMKPARISTEPGKDVIGEPLELVERVETHLEGVDAEVFVPPAGVEAGVATPGAAVDVHRRRVPVMALGGRGHDAEQLREPFGRHPRGDPAVAQAHGAVDRRVAVATDQDRDRLLDRSGLGVHR